MDGAARVGFPGAYPIVTSAVKSQLLGCPIQAARRQLEKVWARLQQAVPHKTHAGVLNGSEKWTCPKNGSENVSVSKTKVTALGTKQFQMNCRDCGCYYTISQKSHNDYKEEKMREKERKK